MQLTGLIQIMTEISQIGRVTRDLAHSLYRHICYNHIKQTL